MSDRDKLISDGARAEELFPYEELEAASFRWFFRVGDPGDYESARNVLAFAAELWACGVRGPVRQCGHFGIEAEGFTGQNYISIYFGPDFETPVRGLSQSDLDAINAHLETCGD
jgi:hypothetical protein